MFVIDILCLSRILRGKEGALQVVMSGKCLSIQELIEEQKGSSSKFSAALS